MSKLTDVIGAKVDEIDGAVQARRRALVGVFQVLAGEHGEIAALIDRAGQDRGQCEALWPDVKIAVLSHERGELAAVYPELGRFERLKELVQQHADETNRLEQVIVRLDTTTHESCDWEALFESLGGFMRAHALEEETVIFPIALEVIGPEHVKRLERDYQIAQKMAQASLRRLTH